MYETKWRPLEIGKLEKIDELFHEIYPENEYGDLGSQISVFWLDLLKKSWDRKDDELKRLDLGYDPSDPLSRVSRKTTVIAYADSISRKGEPTLVTLDGFFRDFLPAIGGLHVLPACRIVEDRFNDGYFSQVERDNIHSAFGTNELFADIMHRYFSMNDLVLGHVDIENPVFKKYLAGDDKAGKTFFVFSTEEYEKLKEAGSFDKVFRPRPFPLFTIFRRTPKEEPFRSMSAEIRTEAFAGMLFEENNLRIEHPLVHILRLFSKIKNDQMLLDEDYSYVEKFVDWLEKQGICREKIFSRSLTQEVQHYPYIFSDEIIDEASFLIKCGFSDKEAVAASEFFRINGPGIFGEEIRALTTFSHVQVDVSTANYEGLKTLAEDLMWYLSMDLNMLRLDAVNYAFKKWGTSCFGLPELDLLMEIVYLSMECISPRMIPNLEVNDSLTTILKQMSSGEAPPPMMHDFYLASLLPAVFHTRNPDIIGRIFTKIAEYDIPGSSIRFSLSESHDGKSVRGSMDLLTFEERMLLTAAVGQNGGFVKYKSIPKRLCQPDEFRQFCKEIRLDFNKASGRLFYNGKGGELVLRDEIDSPSAVEKIVPGFAGKNSELCSFYFDRILEGREPYELCISTRDILPRLTDKSLEAERLLAFQTLAFAVMGRNVKTIYFNDLLGLPNDYEKVKRTGELRNIKRTKVDLDVLMPILGDKQSFESRMLKGMNNLIALVDSDPALCCRGNEAEYISLQRGIPAVVVRNSREDNFSITIVNLSENSLSLSLPSMPFAELYDNISGRTVLISDNVLRLELSPFGRVWLSPERVEISPDRLI